MISLFLYRFPFTLLFLFRCCFRFRFRFLFPFPFLFRIPVSGFSRRHYKDIVLRSTLRLNKRKRRHPLKKFTCSSGHLTLCFQDLFDFICTSLSALNFYFALFKTTHVHKRRSWSGFFFGCRRLRAFQRPRSLIRRKI